MAEVLYTTVQTAANALPQIHAKALQLCLNLGAGIQASLKQWPMAQHCIN
jgi:hypothetical protein